jgi:hypothetical protein
MYHPLANTAIEARDLQNRRPELKLVSTFTSVNKILNLMRPEPEESDLVEQREDVRNLRNLGKDRIEKLGLPPVVTEYLLRVKGCYQTPDNT